jgi:biopolymer transport protein ExbB
VKFGAPQVNAVIFSRLEGGRSLVIGADRGSPYVEVTADSGKFRSTAGVPVATPGWRHLALTANGTTLTLFLDGEVYATLAAALPALNSPLNIGGDGLSAFAGEIDELAISGVARSGGFIKFSALEQGGEKAAKLLVVGEEERPKSWLAFLKTGYVGIIIGSLTIDGWIVIGILGVMMIISWGVMIGKALYLGRVGRGNELFLTQWRQVATDLSVLDSEDPAQAKSLGGRVSPENLRVMRESPLFRVYHIGVEEIRHRLAADRSHKVLSARSIQAIRAGLDGGLVRETHRLSSQMVLLTIAISGGPFLGLLGTVVGVMITFAAVAAAGDVNVNAIAPGIAAALAATVAGLAVAIPALFGYNYLLTRIKAAQSDLHVFIDEFVAKMAEFYSETADANRTITRAPFAPSEPVTPKK